MKDNQKVKEPAEIGVIIGLGNPGPAYYHNRHSIGFRVVDALAQTNGASWRSRDDMELTEIALNNKNILLVKPQTFMNSSGRVIPFLLKKGFKPENILVVHDEIEMPFGKITSKFGGSARGHNGLKSIIAACGEQFYRVRCGVDRPEKKEDVPSYVLQNFSEAPDKIETFIHQAITVIDDLVHGN
jgi:peptidyl-tRNA hydrolase, PTH1 family